MGQLVGQGRKISSRMLEMVGPPAQSSKISEKPGVTGLGPFNGKPRGLKRSGISMDITWYVQTPSVVTCSQDSLPQESQGRCGSQIQRPRRACSAGRNRLLLEVWYCTCWSEPMGETSMGSKLILTKVVWSQPWTVHHVAMPNLPIWLSRKQKTHRIWGCLKTGCPKNQCSGCSGIIHRNTSSIPGRYTNTCVYKA